MLQHNMPIAEAGRRAHWAHAGVVSLHAICCGMPALMLALTALSGAAAGVTMVAQAASELHALLHAHEIWVLAASAALVAGGGALELAARRGQASRGFPWLFLMSAACFALNVTILLAHRV